MSDKTESPALLSPARVVEMQVKSAEFMRINPPEDRPWWNKRVVEDDVADLLADRAAFRQQVAAELAALLSEHELISPYPGMSDREYYELEGVNRERERRLEEVNEIAARLGIELPR